MARRGVTRALAVAVATLTVTAWAWNAGLLDGLERLCQDSWHVLAGKRREPLHAVVVAIDDEALERFAATPLVFWGPVYARAAERLRQAGARCVALDALLAVTPADWLSTLETPPEALLDHDLPFLQTLGSGFVILAAQLARTPAGFAARLPAREYLEALPSARDHVGLTFFPRDPDKVVRRFVRALPDAQAGPGWQTLAALGAARLAPPLGNAPDADPLAARPIDFTGPPGTIPRVSLARFAGNEPPSEADVALVRGRVALVGADFEGSGDRQPTPYSLATLFGGARDMTGVEVHANIVETLAGAGPLKLPPAWVAVACWLPLLTLISWRAEHSSPLHAAGACLLAAACAWGAGFGLFLAGWLVPVSGAVAGPALAWAAAGSLRLRRTERDRARVRRIFGRYVSAEALEHILKDGGEPRLGGDPVEITVLFSDIRDFTTLSERLDAPELVELLNAWFELACEAVQRHGGMIDKFIGDAVMGVFGTPVPAEDHARRAVAAALALEEAAREMDAWVARRFPDLGPGAFRVGVGLHAGEAVAGNIGSSTRMEFTVIGDTVNTASRIEGLCKTMGATVLASEAVTRAAGPGLVTGRSETLPVKGKVRPVRVFAVLGLEDSKETS
ncbi:Adenylate cyclase 1 [Fundidesulfovibrio magnetotacticus]|uniref:Adenylate cyclase 1 n=1 Tax=Fundidesulfovibrio magnetotacticus TaxID=2730080 RepID=A0A6V8LPT0_9BACT|nr:adenylate/guanylate cyclase domain-containing protein [Fundidesulfovibrio magnetotacticus]GFK93724.1 Adenylate cyclase 1 [Fundidesulfovibrio magnetotacticus]